MAGDRVVIEGLRCMAHVGVTQAERRTRQRLLLDLALELPLAKAGQRDVMTLTVDYARAAALAKGVAEQGGGYRLVEAVAEKVAGTLLKTFPLVVTITVRVRKFSVPGAASVGVEIVRKRR